MNSLLVRLFRKLLGLVTSIRFRLAHRLFGGTLLLDRRSLGRIGWGHAVTLRGVVAVNDGDLRVGNVCSIARQAEVGVAVGGAIVLEDGVSLGPRTIVSTTAGRIEIGKNTSFFSDCLVSGQVTIGADCLFANNVSVLTGTHQIYGRGTIRENDAAAMNRPGYSPYCAVTIGPDCWLGANSVILPGVTLGRGCVVGANAVVTKSFPDYSILGGVPAELIGSRLDKH